MTIFSRMWGATLAAIAACLVALPAHAVSDIQDFSTTAASNVDVGGVSMAEGMDPGLLNNGVRELIAQLKRAIANRGTAISSAATTNICATGTSIFAHVTGTTTITSFGTAAAGCTRLVVFDGILTLTHNAVSLILPSGANITTAANDNALAVSEGSGNWRVLFYETASGAVVGGFSSVTATSTDAGAGAGPVIDTFRQSASPAANDLIGQFRFTGQDSASNSQIYCYLEGRILDPTSTSEDGAVHFKCVSAGTSPDRMIVGQGVQIGAAPTGGDKGAGTVNVDTGIYIDGAELANAVAQIVSDSNNTYTTLGTILPIDNSIPQNTEGVEILSVAITPKSASSLLKIEFTGSFGGSSMRCSAALFVDTTANALDANGTLISNSGQMNTIAFNHTVTAGSTLARTYKIRAGSDVAADCFLNGDSVSRQFGGIATAELIVTEYLP